MGRKYCLLMYYVELIDTKLWMAKEVVALNGGLESKMVEGKIIQGILKQCMQVFLLSSLVFRGW